MKAALHLLALALCLSPAPAREETLSDSPFPDTGESADPFAPASSPSSLNSAYRHEPALLLPRDPTPRDPRDDYPPALDRHLRLNEPYLLRMLVRPSFTAEHVVDIRADGDPADPGSLGNFTISSRRADTSIWYSLPSNDPDNLRKPVEVTSSAAPLPAATGSRLRRLWDTMIRPARITADNAAGMDGTVTEFSSPAGHAETWSPGPYSTPGLLTDLGASLLTYSQAPDTERPALLDGIHCRIARLELRLGLIPGIPAAPPFSTNALANPGITDRTGPTPEMWHPYLRPGHARRILLDGREIAFSFSARSDPAAVKSLLSLGHHIVSPNLQLLGTYHPDTREFRLRRWRIIPPFQLVEPSGELATRSTLGPADFVFHDYDHWLYGAFDPRTIHTARPRPAEYILPAD